MIQLGTIVDGRPLAYDASLYEFRVDRTVVTYKEVWDLDVHGHLNWLAPEQHDWFHRINPADLDRCNREALGRHGNGYEGLSPEEQVLADAKRNDSVLAGKIVEADPALVHAVVEEIEKQGLLSAVPAGMPVQVANPLAAATLPTGMEALSQLAKHENRQMTPLEGLLMKRILKNDDKAKAKREKDAEKNVQAMEKEQQKEERELEKTGNITKAQRRKAAKEEREQRGLETRSAAGASAGAGAGVSGQGATPVSHVVSDAMTAYAAAASQPGGRFSAVQGHPQAAFSQVVYYDSQGNPIQPEPDAMRPSLSQNQAYMTAEEKALTEMRARNLAQSASMDLQATNVPGMDGAGVGGRRRRKQDGGSVNGREVNPDGTPKENAFTKFLGGLGKVVDVVSPLAGGGHGGGGGRGGSGGGGAGGGMGGSGGSSGMGGGMGGAGGMGMGGMGGGMGR